MKLCPNCVEYLKTDKRKFAGSRSWLVCGGCGYRIRADEENKAEHTHLIGDILKGANSFKQYIEHDPGKERKEL